MSRTERFNKFRNVCNSWMYNKCEKANCKYIHDPELCVEFYKTGNCNGMCGKNHYVNPVLITQYNRTNKTNRNKSNKYYSDDKDNKFETELKQNSRFKLDSNTNSNTNSNANTNSNTSLVRKIYTRNNNAFTNSNISNISNVSNVSNVSNINDINNSNNSNNTNKYINTRKPTNTETFEPDYSPPEMRVRFEYGKIVSNLTPTQSNDVLIVPDLFADMPNAYTKLLNEIFATKFDKHDLIIPWHEGCHLIVDDHMDWKRSCPTFNLIIERIARYFSMDVKATRFNWYQKNEDWKAFHYDSAAIDERRARTQNFTIGVSFGAKREIAFQVANHKDCRYVVSFPLDNGTTFCFGKDVNIDWRHGILPIKQNTDIFQGIQANSTNNVGRISIIAWGYINQIDMKPDNKIYGSA